MREDDAAAGKACETDVRQGGERLLAVHSLERSERGQEPGAVVRTERGEVQPGEALRSFLRGDAGQGDGALIERQERDDRQRRDLADAIDRVDQLLQVVERLDHEQVRAPALEDHRLLGEQLVPDAGAGGLAERADRAGDEDVAADGLARLAGELDRGRVDRLEVVLEEVLSQLAPVRAEAVRLDQVCAGIDEADVKGYDGVRPAGMGRAAAPPDVWTGGKRAQARRRLCRLALYDSSGRGLTAIILRLRGLDGGLRPAVQFSWITRPSMPPATVTTWPVTWPESSSEARTTTCRATSSGWATIFRALVRVTIASVS